MIYAIYDTQSMLVVGHSSGQGAPAGWEGFAVLEVDEVPQAGSLVLDGKITPPAAPAPDLSTLKASMALRITVERDEWLARGVPTEVGRVQADPVSRMNIQASLSLARATDDYQTSWRLADNTTVQLDARGVEQLASSVDRAVGSTYARSFALKGRLDAATNTDEALAILIDYEA